MNKLWPWLRKILFVALDQLEKRIERNAKGKVDQWATWINIRIDLPVFDENQEQVIFRAGILGVLDFIRYVASQV